MRNILVIATLFWSVSVSAQKYKSMMNDYSYNFYEVVEEAEKYFENHDKGKGSGFKGYMRWKSENEGRFYPSGDRSKISPYFVQDAWRSIKAEQRRISSRGNQNPWVDLGPYDANNVTSHYSEGIGRVETFYVDPSDTNKMYLGSRSGGFWRTADGGKNWLCTTDTMIATGVFTLSASQTHSDSVVISLNNANNNYSQGVYTSIDGGITWTLSGFNPTALGWGGLGKTGRVYVIAVDPWDSRIVYVGTDRGLYKSTDFMNSYTRVQMNGNYRQIAFHPTKKDHIYVYDRNSPNQNVLLASTDGGLNFTASATVPGNNGNRTVRLSVSRACSDCVYFSSNNGVWKSVDEGQTFTFLSNPSQSGNGFSVSDVDTSKMIYGYVDLMASDDGGQNFTQRTWWAHTNANHTGSSYIHADLRAAGSVNGTFYVGTDGYLCSSSDGGISWKILSDGTGIREFYRFGISQSKSHLSMAGSQDNGTSIEDHGTWIEWNGGDGMEAIVHTLNEEWMIGSWQFGNRNRTQDGGLTRNNVGHGSGNDWIAPMFFDPNHQMHVYSMGQSIQKSEVYGGNWQPLANPGAGNIRQAAIAENNSKIMAVVRNSDFFISTDGGVTVTDKSNSLPNTRSISAVEFDPLHDSTIIIAYDSYQDDNRRIYVSHDLGDSWTNISFNLSNMPLRCIAIDHSNERNIYVGGEIGVYYMPMGGSSWTLYSVDLPNVSVRDLEIQWATNTLRAVTWGRGMFETKLVDRENFPSITSIDMSEKPNLEQPVEDLPIDIWAEVNHTGVLKSVYLKWSKDSADFSNTIVMQPDTGNIYKTVSPIPNFVAGTEMYFKVYAEADNGDLTESYKFNYSYRVCNNRPQNVKANASKTNIFKGDSVVLLGSGAITYSWDNGVQDGVYFTPQTTKTYTVTGRDLNNCAGYDSVKIEVTDLVGLLEVGSDKVSKVYPNPASNMINVQLNQRLESARIEVIDMRGKVLFEATIADSDFYQISLDAFKSGNYNLRISDRAGQQVVPFVVQ